jgi:hypothetical protein
MVRRPLFHVSGNINGVPDFERGLITVHLERTEGGISQAMSSAAPGDGSFRFPGVPPGRYIATAGALWGEAVKEINPLAGARLEAKIPVTVTDHDIEGLTLAPQPELHLNGSFRMEKVDTPLPANLSVQFNPAVPLVAASNNIVAADTIGTFALHGFADTYSVQPIVPETCAATEIRYAGINYLNQLIPINGDTADPTLTIVLSNQPATAGGSIDGEAKAQAKVVLAPWPLPENFDLRSLRVAITDKQGAFSFHGLPPGNYKTAVLTGDDRKRDHDLAILNDKFATADAFEITAGQSLTITPKP